MVLDGISRRRPTIYSDDGQDMPPPVALSANTVHMQSEEFEGEYNPKSASKNNNEPSGVKHKMGNILGGMKGALKNHKGSGVNMTVREIIVFAFYLMVLCIIAFSSKSTSRYYFTQAMTNLFVNVQNEDGLTFMDITDMEGVWRYMDEQLMDGLYWETEVGDDNSTEMGMVYYENRLLGKPKIRMLKVNNHSCTVVDSFSREIKECFSQYKKDQEDTDTIDIQAPDVLDGPDDYQMFEYRTAENLSTTDLWGEIATYGGGGFVAFLDIDSRQQAMDVISKLKANRWMDRGTRVVIVDFALYNANINLFCIATLMFELPATGGVIPTANFDSLTLIRYVSKWDYVILVCEGIFTAFVVFFVIELSVITIVLSLKRTHISEKRVNELVSDDLEFANLDDVVSACSLYNNFVAVLLFFAWIKIFKYISFNKTMSQLSATLSRSAKDIGGFAVMFFVFFFAYAQFGYLCFGTQIRDYSTFYSAVFALLRTILGDFDFHALERANRVLGPTFFITYVFFVFFVLLNMFLAIINDTYVEVKGELEKQKNDFEVADFFKNKFYRVLRFLRLTKKDDPTESTANYGDWRQSLIERGFNDREINEKFAKFDITEDRTYTEDEKATVEAELEKEKTRKEEELTNTQRDYISVIRRVQLIEDAIKRVHSDVNVVLTRFETIEGRKVQAKENEVSTLARDVFNSADKGNSYDRP